MKNKKGFTLIELLAVIVILAIIMVIATMQVNKTIKKARQDSFALSFKSLKKQIQQRIVTGEEYLCYDSVRGNGKISNMHDFFGNNFPSICGTGTKDQIRSKKEIINGEEKEFYVTGTISDYGVRACQDIYDISDDYRMWVSYQAANGDVSLLLNTTDGKFKGTPYIQGVVGNRIYIMDCSNRIQYYFDFEDNLMHKCNNEDGFIQFYNGKNFENRNIYDALNEKLYFVRSSIQRNSENEFVEFDKTSNYYYLWKREKDNYQVYRSLDDTFEQMTYLFETSSKFVLYLEDGVIYQQENDIWYTSDVTGSKKILENKELEFNDTIIYGIIK